MAGAGGGDTYASSFQSPGVALVIVNKNFSDPGYKTRQGASQDYQRLKQTFESLGYQVKAHFNLTAADILRAVQEVRRLDHTNNANLVVAISSHGERAPDKSLCRTCDSVIGTDCRPVFLWNITQAFGEYECPSLKGKPKLFFLQACRGTELSEEATASSETTVMKTLPSGEGMQDSSEDLPDIGGSPPGSLLSQDIPLKRDFLLACCTPPDFFAFHNTQGSWFVRELCDEVTTSSRTLDLQTMLTKVNWLVSQRTTNTPSNLHYHGRHTMPWVASMLTKRVYLAPRA